LSGFQQSLPTVAFERISCGSRPGETAPPSAFPLDLTLPPPWPLALPSCPPSTALPRRAYGRGQGCPPPGPAARASCPRHGVEASPWHPATLPPTPGGGFGTVWGAAAPLAAWSGGMERGAGAGQLFAATQARAPVGEEVPNRPSCSNALHTAARHASHRTSGHKLLYRLAAPLPLRLLLGLTRSRFQPVHTAARYGDKLACAVLLEATMDKLKAAGQGGRAEQVVWQHCNPFYRQAQGDHVLAAAAAACGLTPLPADGHKGRQHALMTQELLQAV
ncbi:hypothetical protein V8C86DRAFT_2431733, partial [Haematococcus lacustris]